MGKFAGSITRRCDVCGGHNGGAMQLRCGCEDGGRSPDYDALADEVVRLRAECESLRADRDRMWPVWKLRYAIRHKLDYLLRDYPDDKETKRIIAELEGAIWLEDGK